MGRARRAYQACLMTRSPWRTAASRSADRMPSGTNSAAVNSGTGRASRSCSDQQAFSGSRNLARRLPLLPAMAPVNSMRARLPDGSPLGLQKPARRFRPPISLQHEPISRPPLRQTYRDTTLLAPPPPTQGITTLGIMGVLNHLPMTDFLPTTRASTTGLSKR